MGRIRGAGDGPRRAVSRRCAGLRCSRCRSRPSVRTAPRRRQRQLNDAIRSEPVAGRRPLAQKPRLPGVQPLDPLAGRDRQALPVSAKLRTADRLPSLHCAWSITTRSASRATTSPQWTESQELLTWIPCFDRSMWYQGRQRGGMPDGDIFSQTVPRPWVKAARLAFGAEDDAAAIAECAKQLARELIELPGMVSLRWSRIWSKR